MYLPQPLLFADLLIDIIGAIANALSFHYVKKSFDLSKTVFRVLLFDCFSGFCISIVFMVTNLVWIIFPSTKVKLCWMMIVSYSSFNRYAYLGITLSLIIASIR